MTALYRGFVKLVAVLAALAAGVGALVAEGLERPGAVLLMVDQLGEVTAVEAMWGGGVVAVITGLLYAAARQVETAGWPSAPGPLTRRALRAERRAQRRERARRRHSVFTG